MTDNANELVGVWEVHAPEAPFPRHMMTFTPYGTMSQSNPHEGNKDESDSMGQGVWRADVQADGLHVRGKFVEYKADRETGMYIGKGVISFRFTVSGDRFAGICAATRYDADGILVRSLPASLIEGTRVTLDDVHDLVEGKE